MKAHDRRARDRRDFRPEALTLEDRKLMNGTPASPPLLVAHHTGFYHWNPANWGGPVVVHATVDHVARPTTTTLTHTHKVAVLTGQIRGNFAQPPALPGQDVAASAIGKGVGRAHQFITYTTNYIVHREDIFSGAATINAGSAQFSSTKLGQIDVGYSGTEQLSRDQANASFKLTGAVTSVVGGRYHRATEGTFNAVGTINPATGQFLMNYTICLFRVGTKVVRIR